MHQRLWHDHQHATDHFAVELVVNNQPGFDGFTQTDLISEQDTRRGARTGLTGDVELVRNEINACAAQTVQIRMCAGVQSISSRAA